MKVERRPVQQNLHAPATIHRAGAGRGFSRLSPDRQSFDQIARNVAELLCFRCRRLAARFLFDPFHTIGDTDAGQQ